MTRSLVLPRYPLGTGLIRTKGVVSLGGLRALHQIQRFSHASPSLRSHPLPASHIQQPRCTSNSRHSTATQIQPLLKPNPHGWRGFTTTRAASSSVSRDAATGSGSTEGKTTNNTNKTPKRRFTKKTLLLATLGALPIWFISQSTDSDGQPRDLLLEWTVGKPLNNRSFVPFTIISRDQVSPTSFIITLKPKYSRDSPLISTAGDWLPRFLTETHSNKNSIQKAWSYGLWSLEFKQPQLQVAREYTPLPSSYGGEQKDLEKGYLRFLIRKMDGGEVSTYLSGLSVGDDVELRGPHLGFDVRSRLGYAEKVAFLAGGTGIAPALQVVRALLDGLKDGDLEGKGKPEVSIIWANRHRADCEGCDGLSQLFERTGHVERGEKSGNAVLSLLAEAKARHGEKLRYACTVDEEGSFVTSKAIADITGLSSSSSPGTNDSGGGFFLSFWSSKPTVPAVQSASPSPVEEETCAYHSAKRLITTDGSEDSLISKPTLSLVASSSTADQNQDAQKASGCQCHPNENGGSGKNLLIVSGPDGFISAFVGPKLWANRKELQGPVRGVVGGALRKKDPEFWRDWLVLKM